MHEICARPQTAAKYGIVEEESWKRYHEDASCRRIVEEELWTRRLYGGTSWRHGGGVMENASWHGGEQHL